MRAEGNWAPELMMAVRTRSLDSSTALSGRPTIVKDGRPREATSTSTSTGTGLRPIVAPEKILASMVLSSKCKVQSEKSEYRIQNSEFRGQVENRGCRGLSNRGM
jgi:hypothetical protein